MNFRTIGVVGLSEQYRVPQFHCCSGPRASTRARRQAAGSLILLPTEGNVMTRFAYIVVDRYNTVVASYTLRKQALHHAWPLGGTVVAAPITADYGRDDRRTALCRNCTEPLALSDDVWFHQPVEQQLLACRGPDGKGLGSVGEPDRPHDEEADGCTHPVRGGQAR